MATWSVILITLSFHAGFAAKILFVPGATTSHCLEMMSVGEELMRRGHQVTLFSLMYDPQHCITRVNATSYKSRFKSLIPKLDPSYQKIHDGAMKSLNEAIYQRKGLLTMIAPALKTFVPNVCDATFGDKDALKELERDQYDLVVVEAVSYTGYLFAISKYLGVPAAGLGSFVDPQDSRMPLQTNTFPSLYTEFSNEMTFIQRLLNTVIFLVNPIGRYFILPSVDLSQYSDKLAGIDTSDLVKESVLFLENSDHIVDYPKALFPNFVQVGGLTAGPSRPLSVDLKRFMDESKGGVVLVTFGSFLSGFPNHLIEKLMTAFGRLQHKVLFKLNKDDIHGNIKVMKWVPQNDILGHPNTKLFISHCGKNGFWESVYHGVPIICMAIHAETHITKVKVRKYGIGSSINIFDDSVEELVETINGVLSNHTIDRNMKRKSILLRDRPETPRQRAASAIEHVIKNGGDHMRPPSVDFGFYTYINLDVWITLFVINFLITAFGIWLIRKWCCRGKSSKTKTE